MVQAKSLDHKHERSKPAPRELTFRGPKLPRSTALFCRPTFLDGEFSENSGSESGVMRGACA